MSSEDSKLVEKIREDLTEEESRLKVVIVESGNVVSTNEMAVSLKNPYSVDPTDYLIGDNAMSLPKFFKIASKLIEDAQDRAGVIASKRIKLVEENPPKTLEHCASEVITYKVLKREPALMNAKATSRPQRKSMYAYDALVAEKPNKVIVVESRPVDHVIEFTCWAVSNKLANKRVLWLEKLFVNHAWAFETHGVERFYWKGRSADTFSTVDGEKLFCRPISFFVRFSEFEVKSHPQIKQIVFEVKGS